MGQGIIGSHWIDNSGTWDGNQVTLVNEINRTCVCSYGELEYRGSV